MQKLDASRGYKIGELYDPAMKVTDQDEANAYFAELVNYSMAMWGQVREEAERVTRSNLGYYAGYYDHETRARVERLFHCSHPIFGAIAERGAPTTEEAFEAGRRIGEAMRKRQDS